MIKRVLIVLIFIFGVNFCFGQAELPKLISPAPSTSSLFKFQDYPVDYSTGLVQISLPLYEVKSGSLTVPISLSYHSAGRKVYDQDGSIALGWSLNAGGMISRVIHGTADFGLYKFPYPFKVNNLTNYNDLSYFQRILRYQNTLCDSIFPYLDTEYDIFSYSFCGKSGKFIFKDNNNIKTPVFLPYKPYKITPITSTPPFVTFEMTDDDGVLYQFEGSEFVQLDENATTGWHLKKMISADKTDTISFVYTGAVETRKTISQVIKYVDDWNDESAVAPAQPNPSQSENLSQANYQVTRLSEIIYNQGKVKFNLVSGTSRLDNIQIINLNNEVIKTIKFNTSSAYFQAEINNATNKLDNIEFKDKLTNVVERYSYEYYPIDNSLINGPINVRYRDWWGYYNNSGQNDLIPKFTVSSIGPQTVQDIGNPYGNRQPSLEPLKSVVLKKIIYPTGGNTEFVYQLNKCKINGGDGSIVNGPGLRIYQVKSTDGTGTIISKTYKYGNSESGYGYLELLPDVNAIMNTQRIQYFGGLYWDPPYLIDGWSRERYFTSEMYDELSEVAQRPVMYQEVTEYLGTESFNSGKTVYKYDYTPWAASGFFPRRHVANFNYWNTPSLLERIDFKRVKSEYTKVKSSRNIYTATTLENIVGLHVQRAYSTPQGNYGSSPTPWSTVAEAVCSEQYAAYARNLPIYTSVPYQVVSGYKNLTTTYDTLFTTAGNQVNSTTYSYNSYNLLSSTNTYTSKNELITKTIKYPTDYTGNSVLTQMTALNIISLPIEQIETKAGLPIKSVRTNFKNWGTTPARFAPETIDQSIGNNAYETRLRYYSYDIYGNPLTVSKELDMNLSYIWGYNNTYPIAEFTNSASKNVFHTSFEDGSGNSALNDAKTGKYSKTGGFSKMLTNLDNGSYILSYWQKSGSTWSLQKSNVSVTTTGYPIALMGQVDEVRFYPVSATMKTFTYEPLVGLLSICDESDHIQFFEYDAYGRLKVVKDLNGHIIQTNKYQLQSPISY